MSTITTILEPAADGTLHVPLPALWKLGKFRVSVQVEPLAGMPVAEHAMVRLRRDLPDAGIDAGELGSVVHVHEGGGGYEVEFLGGRRRPKLVTVEPADIELAE